MPSSHYVSQYDFWVKIFGNFSMNAMLVICVMSFLWVLQTILSTYIAVCTVCPYSTAEGGHTAGDALCEVIKLQYSVQQRCPLVLFARSVLLSPLQCYFVASVVLMPSLQLYLMSWFVLYVKIRSCQWCWGEVSSVWQFKWAFLKMLCTNPKLKYRKLWVPRWSRAITAHG